VAAETFRVAFDKRRQYQTAYEDARPWLYGIAVKLLQHHFRDRRQRDAVALRSAQLTRRPAMPDGYQEQLIIGADTGIPVKFLGGDPAKPEVTVTYDVTRVSTDNLK
jgi:DNA-directed RNA polymerase specialized sigma24 family protein